jgi:hypothetical protein
MRAIPGWKWRSVPRDESMLGETLGCGPSSTTNSTLKPPKPFVTRAMVALPHWRIH